MAYLCCSALPDHLAVRPDSGKRTICLPARKSLPRRILPFDNRVLDVPPNLHFMMVRASGRNDIELTLTFDARIAGWIVGRTVTNGAFAFGAALGVGTASSIRTRIDGRSSAKTSFDSISDTSGLARTAVAANCVRADGVGSARIGQTLVDVCYEELKLDQDLHNQHVAYLVCTQF